MMYGINDLQAELTKSESYPFIPTLAGIQTSISDTPEFYRVRDANGKNQYIEIKKVEGINTGVKFSIATSPFEVSGFVNGRKFFDRMKMVFPEQC